MAGGNKHALIEVPDFSGGMTSYLRLGAAAPLGSLPGDDLAARITSFEDDTRKREPGAPSEGERQAETAKLHTKGGWRDHSDGNRISTTRGDKIEVIGGNYRMLILGRGEHDSGWDVSGGHVGEVGETFAGGSTIEWVEEYGGTWKVVETTVKGQVDTTYHGNVIDRYYGKKKESTTGQEVLPTLSVKDDSVDDSKPDNINTVTTLNPVIVDRTWAESISSYTGSAALPVPSMKDVTWAKTVESETHATAMTDKTFADSTDSTTAVTGAITTVTSARSMKDTTTVEENVESESTAKKFISTTHGDSDDTTYGDTKSYSKGDSFTEVVGMETTINYGLVNELVLGAMIDSTIGATASLTVGASVDVNVSASADFSLSAKFSCTAGPSLEVGPEKVTLSVDKTHVGLSDKSIALMKLFV
jgi:hypothetical protein